MSVECIDKKVDTFLKLLTYNLNRAMNCHQLACGTGTSQKWHVGHKEHAKWKKVSAKSHSKKFNPGTQM